MCTINTLGPMQTIPQISHLSFPLGSRMLPTEEKALASGPGCEPFTLAPEASITRKSSAHSSSSKPFMSQASPFSSSTRASTLMLQAGKEGKGPGLRESLCHDGMYSKMVIDQCEIDSVTGERDSLLCSMRLTHDKCCLTDVWLLFCPLYLVDHLPDSFTDEPLQEKKHFVIIILI